MFKTSVAAAWLLHLTDVPVNQPAPWIGIWERINIGVFMLWVIVLAIALLRVRQTYDVRAMKPIAAS